MKNLKPVTYHQYDRRKSSRVRVFSFVLAVLLVTSSFLVFADTADKASELPVTNTLGTSKGITLGESGIEIHTPEDLQALGTLVNSGKHHKDVGYVLMENIPLDALETWEPIGTKKHPFKGTLIGNGFQISGIGEDPFTSLFGYLDGATLKDVVVVLSKNNIDNTDLFAGLFVESKDSTIEGCRVLKAGMSFTDFALATSSVTPNTDWFNPNLRSPQGPTTYADLLGLVELVNNDTITAADTITFTGTIDASESGAGVNTFPGIGSKDHPFKANVIGPGTINNLTINNPSQENVGLFGYIEDASISGVNVTNINVVGGDNTGGIVGYAKNSSVKDCSSSGEIKGNNAVGGLIGKSVATGSLVSGLYLENSYSMANVTGVKEIGGIAGCLDFNAVSTVPNVTDKLFSTGTLNGSLQVGGIIGFYKKGADSLTNLSSSSTINGTTGTGGIVGEINYRGASLENVYFSGTVTAFSGVGGIVGRGGRVENAYISGHVIVPNPNKGQVGPITGDIGGSSVPLVGSEVYADMQTLYSPLNPMNLLDALGDDNAYGIQHPGGEDHKFFGEQVSSGSPTTTIIPEFAEYTLGYKTQGAADSAQMIAAEGQYPTLDVFKVLNPMTNLEKAFYAYSELSTKVSFTSLPNRFYASTKATDGSVFASIVKDGTAYELAIASDLGKWSFYGGSSTLKISDPSAKNGEVTLTIEGNKIKMSEPLSLDAPVTLFFDTTLDGLSLQYKIIFNDDFVGIDQDSVDKGLEFSKDIQDTEDTLGKALDTYFIKFHEQIKPTHPPTSGNTFDVPLLKYASYADFQANLSSISTTPAKVTILGNDTLRIKLDKSDFDFNHYYTLDFESAAQGGTNSSLQDGNGNVWEENIHFKTDDIKKPTINFTRGGIASRPENVVTSSASEQTLVFTEGNDTLGRLWSGIFGDGQNPFDPGTKKPKTVMNATKTVSGRLGYETLVSDPVPVNGSTGYTNFYNIPGTYTVDYEEEVDGETTNKITRTYRINGKSQVTKNGEVVRSLAIVLDAKDMEKLYALSRELGSVEKALDKMVYDLYLSSDLPVESRIQGRFIDYTGTEKNVDLEFDFANIGEEIFENGLRENREYTIGGKNVGYTLSLAGIQKIYEIQLEEESYHVNRDVYKKTAAKKHFGAKVVLRETGEEVPNVKLEYNFKKVDEKAYGIAHEVEIFIPGTDYEVQGVNMYVNTFATVVIDKNLKWKHPEDKDDVPITFWEPVLDKVRRSAKSTIWEFDIPYEAAKFAPTDFFIVVQNQKEADVTLNFASGIELNVKQADITKEFIEKMDVSIAIEPMYDLTIRRDGQGIPVQQFRSLDKLILPGRVTVTLPLEDTMNTTDLALYLVDEKTNTYKLLESIEESQIKDGKLTLEMNQFQGKYVITSADFNGKTVGRVATVGILPVIKTKAVTPTKKSTAKSLESPEEIPSEPSLIEPPLPKGNRKQPAKTS